MIKHAYLLCAHADWIQLKLLLAQLDYENNDIYLHINIKSTDFNETDIRDSIKNASVFLLNRREVDRCDFSLTEIALDFLEIATKKRYYYYHFLTGSDLLIKSNKYIVDFFDKNGGYEFVESFYPYRYKWYSRYAYKQIFIKYLGANGFKKIIALVLANIYFIIQRIFGYDKVKKNFNKRLMFGSSWWSITHDFAKYVVTQKKWIFDNYYEAFIPAESFIQTVLEDSPFKNQRYSSKNVKLNDNLRLIDWTNQNVGGRGHPHVWTMDDLEIIRSSDNLFARKFFLSYDSQIIYETIKMAQEKN
jgi:hypothetical protein